MSSIFQKVITGDVDSLGTWSKDPVTQKVLCTIEQFGAVPAGKWLRIEYILAVVKGFENADIGLTGEIGFDSGTTKKRIPVQFAQNAENGKFIAHAGQAIKLLVPANGKIIVTVPLFFTGSGPGGGAEIALTGMFLNA
jgi:hypothetical protein